MKINIAALALLFMSTACFAQLTTVNKQSDEDAIKQVIEGLTTSMYARDFKTYLNYWADAPYVSRVANDRDGKVTKMTGDQYRKVIEQAATQSLKPSQEKATRDNWLIRVNGDAAFVVYDQHNQYPDGTTRHSVEERYMERIHGAWKMVNVTVFIER
jgi:ketosteroid isomerase-like protein